MQRLEVSGVVRPIYGSLGVKRLISSPFYLFFFVFFIFVSINLFGFLLAQAAHDQPSHPPQRLAITGTIGHV